ncbi:MAG: flagellar motor switch protein FliN [candidate division Zixibacteria bacterium]|nr:flagellar motor switch protein FliN [candidate division Zixibacteria bacterium]
MRFGMSEEQSQLNDDELNKQPDVPPESPEDSGPSEESSVESSPPDDVKMPDMDLGKTEPDSGEQLDKVVNENDASEADAEAEMLRMMEMETAAAIEETEPVVEKASFNQFTGPAKAESKNLDMLMDVSLPIAIELGRTSMAIEDILNLGPGSVVELDKLAGEPVDLLINNKLLAKGEVVVIDENFGVRITSMVSRPERIRSLQ